MPSNQTHLAQRNKNLANTANLSLTTSVSAPGCALFFPYSETAKPLLEAKSGGNINTGVTVTDKGDGYLQVTGFNAALNGGTLEHPLAKDFIWGSAFNYQSGGALLLKGTFGTLANVSLEISSGSIIGFISDDGGSNRIEVTIPIETLRFVVGEIHSVFLVRNGDALTVVVDGQVLASAEITSAFDTLFTGAAMNNVGAFGNAFGNGCWHAGLVDYVFDNGLPSDYINLLAAIVTNLTSGFKQLPADYVTV